jgi:hypothetical protein
MDMTRRLLLRGSLGLAAAPWLQGCAAPMPVLGASTTTADAASLLAESAAAHGAAAFANIGDISVAYAGKWHTLVTKLQPALVDSGFRGSSQERLLLRDGVSAQFYTGTKGHKAALRHMGAGSQGTVRVWFNGDEVEDTERLDAAALVADGYALFLLGPLLITNQWSRDRSVVMERMGSEKLSHAGGTEVCDILRLRIAPGLGKSAADDLQLFIDRDARLMRRVVFTLNGLESTRGAIARVDTFDHALKFGVRWPSRFHEHLMRPFPLGVHDWRLTGLDVNRGLRVAEVSGPDATGAAAAPAAPLPHG